MSRAPELVEQIPATDPGAPAVWRIEGDSSSIDGIAEWMSEKRADITATLHTDGALVLRRFPQIQRPEDYQRVISAGFPHLRDYVGGSSPRTKLNGRIMTATETPPNWSIPLHQEMAYTRSGPHRVAFLCLAPAPVGGLSLLGDMATALEVIPADIRHEFEGRGLRLRRVLPSRESAASKAGVKKNWQEAFDTDDANVVDAIAEERGWDRQWLTGNTLQLTQELMAATHKHPVTGREVWHNQAHFFAPACMIDWAARDHRTDDERELREVLETSPELVDNVVYGDGGTPVPSEMALAVAHSLRSLERGFALERGDILIVDNILMAHGRSPFSGERRLLVALADEPGWRA